MNQYTIESIQSKRILFYKHIGILSRVDLGEAWDDILKKEEFTMGGYNLVSDYTEATLNFNLFDIQFIEQFLIQLKPILHGKKEAVIIRHPVSTAIALLFETEMQIKIGFKVKVFHNLESAMQWIEN